MRLKLDVEAVKANCGKGFSSIIIIGTLLQLLNFGDKLVRTENSNFQILGCGFRFNKPDIHYI